MALTDIAQVIADRFGQTGVRRSGGIPGDGPNLAAGPLQVLAGWRGGVGGLIRNALS